MEKRKFKILCFMLAIVIMLPIVVSTVLAIEEEIPCTHPYGWSTAVRNHVRYGGSTGSCTSEEQKYCHLCGYIAISWHARNYASCPGSTENHPR